MDSFKEEKINSRKPIMDSFKEEKINSGRQIEWDYAKVFAMILMIVVHFSAFCSFGTLDYGVFTEYMFILLQCSAPLFIVCNGHRYGIYKT